MDEVRLLVATLLQRLRVDHSRALDDEERAEGHGDYADGWAAGFAKGIDHAVTVVEDFLGRFLRR